MANFLCLASYYKGSDFIKSCHECGNKVYLVTSIGLEHKDWPVEYIEEVFYIQQDYYNKWKFEDLLAGTTHLMKTVRIDAIVGVDDFDIENAAALREHFRIPGMGSSTARYFRDKLAMRTKARDAGISSPAFSRLFNDDEINDFLELIPAPWLIKPRGEASAAGITICKDKETVWKTIRGLENLRGDYLIEQFITGQVYHVDSIIFQSKIQYSQVSKYLQTPIEVVQTGGIFRTVTLTPRDPLLKAAMKINEQLIQSFGLKYSVSHAEFIYSEKDKRFYFVEIACRVGGAHISDMVQAASHINLWAEWARIEDHSLKSLNYKLPKIKRLQAGLIISLSKVKKPDYSHFDKIGLDWELQKDYHVGVIYVDPDEKVVLKKIEAATEVIKSKYFTTVPQSDKHSLD
jgi:hypothetical protein